MACFNIFVQFRVIRSIGKLTLKLYYYSTIIIVTFCAFCDEIDIFVVNKKLSPNSSGGRFICNEFYLSIINLALLEIK